MSASNTPPVKDDGQGSSNDKGSSSGKRNLVFLNFSNPSKDSKRTTNRKIVSKYAMLGRARADQAEGGSQETETASDSKAGLPNRHKFVNTSQEEAEASRKATAQRREIVHASRSLPLLAPSTSQRRPLPVSEEAEDVVGKETRQRKLSGIGKPVAHAPAKKPHLSLHRPWRAVVRKNAMPTILSPSDPAGSGSFDPFNTLATGASPRINRLVHAYVNAHVITNRWYQGIPGYGAQLINARRNLWFPLTLESKAASKALIAYLDATPDRPFGSDETQGKYLSEALLETNSALRDKESATTDGTCFAVALLMLTAQRMRDTRAFQTHAHGLAALTSMRQDAPIGSKYSISVFKCFESGNSPPMKPPTSMLTPNASPGSMSKTSSPPSSNETRKPITPPPSATPSSSMSSKAAPSLPLWIPTSATTVTGNGFHDLVTAGLITPTLADFFQRAWVLHSLGENGVIWDRVALISVAEHIWVDDWPPDLAVNFFEKACYAAIQICFHLVVKPPWHFCWPVEKMAVTVFEALTCADMRKILDHCPDTLLWLVMCAGPFLKHEPLEWFAMLLRRVLRAMGPGRFVDATSLMLRRYMWVTNMTPAAQQFWDASVEGSEDDEVPLGQRIVEVEET
ncbi:MAG: hypothetical protein M1828_000842 [Chrysothrix sp. TS-e1954]|nr:MAG: hypothetical protein M1828_000842 [Chrysothrix sp. TS-e1954]